MTTHLPPPPRSLPSLEPADGLVVATGGHIGRLFFRGGRHPSSWNAFRNYGPVSRMRFDHHSPPPGEHPHHGIAYAAVREGRSTLHDPLVAAIAECFGATRVIDTRADEPWFTVWSPTAPLMLLDVVDSLWITRAGGNGAISTGARGIARHWARRIHETYAEVHGIYYQTSSVPAMRSIALNERAAPYLPARPALSVPLAHPGLLSALQRIALDLGMYLIP